jgi:signal transduction histidine kinase
MLKNFLRDKWVLIIISTVVKIFVAVFLVMSGSSSDTIILSLIIYLCVDLMYLVYSYFKYRMEIFKIEKLARSLDRHYYIHELIKRPKNEEAAIYYDLMKLANQDMVTEIGSFKKEANEYREFIEEWIHEMKTPLTTIQMLSSTDEDEMGSLQQEVNRLRNLLDICLHYIRVGTLEKDYHVLEFNVLDMLHEIFMDEKTQIMLKDIEIQINISPEQEIVSDKKWVSFMIHQVLLNAIKYVDYGGKIQIHDDEKDNIYWIHIEDNGCGIKKSDLPRIFEKGFTGSTMKRKSSSGLGLYLVKTTANKMNVKLNINSKIGEYTKVSLGFPIGIKSNLSKL